MTRTLRLDAFALAAVWALGASALGFAARLPLARPRLVVAQRVDAPFRWPERRPPTQRGTSVTAPANRAPSVDLERTATDSASAAFTGEEISIEGYGITSDGWSGDEEWSDVGGWIGSFPWGRWGRSGGARWRRFGGVAPGFAPFFTSSSAGGAQGDDPCAVFPAACGERRPVGAGWSTGRVARSVGVEPVVAQVAHRATLWQLLDDAVVVDIDTAALCAVVTHRDDGVVARAAFAPPGAERCTVRETTVPWPSVEGSAIEVTWTGTGAPTHAVIALADGADAPEAALTRATADGGTLVGNAGNAPLRWMDGAAPVEIPAGGTSTVRGPASASP